MDGKFYYIPQAGMLTQKVTKVTMLSGLEVTVFTKPNNSCFGTQLKWGSKYSSIPTQEQEWNEFVDDIKTHNKFYYMTPAAEARIRDLLVPIHFDESYENGEAFGLIASEIFFDYYSTINPGPLRTKKALALAKLKSLSINYKGTSFHDNGNLNPLFTRVYNLVKDGYAPFRRLW